MDIADPTCASVFRKRCARDLRGTNLVILPRTPYNETGMVSSPRHMAKLRVRENRGDGPCDASPVAPVSHQTGYYVLVIRLFSVGCQ